MVKKWHLHSVAVYLRIDSSEESLNACRKVIDSPLFIGRPKFIGGKLTADKIHIYHAANPGFGGTEDNVNVRRICDFERLAGIKIAWPYYPGDAYVSWAGINVYGS